MVKWKIDGLFKASAQECADELAEIQEVTAESVVDYAREHPESNLHQCFEWNNQKAATKYREYQARKLLLNLVVVDESKGREQEPHEINLFYNISDHSQQYYPVSVVVANPDKMEQLKLKCKDYLRAAEKKFACIESLDLQLLEDLIAGI